ncbi:DUF4178 domain-containing protein [Leptospira haakeii]|uniref:DUF4178 domain-containing protein n=1 Tax=Leptospira haakeii TaxID=2023198 RepID=A0ABX4PRA6_9LEPT|nr:DUF4178 domain-containing protein [Leptospira haakeii]PKA17242.1 hypothetical protein CH363_00895 [Leptospira haakeii]PKA20966.1 hypothetical protein CH377_00895 [Leptospira haakeii]
MSELSCPNCGAPVPIINKASVYAVCSSCKTLSLKKDVNLEKIGTAGELADDHSIIQLGTQGNYNGTPFRVIGRIQLKFELGFWNEWHLMEGDGSSAWLGEAQGSYYYTKLNVGVQTDKIPTLEGEEDPIVIASGRRERITPGDSFYLGENWTLKEIMKATCIGGEGELPIGFQTGYEAVLLDLASEDGMFGTLDYSESPALLFSGNFSALEELNLTGLRQEEVAYNQTQVPAKSIECKGCGASLNQFSPDFSKSLACEYCGSVMDTESDDLKIIAKFDQVSRDNVLLPLGTPIKLPNFPESKVIGVLRKSTEVDDETYTWTDYLLRYKGGYAWLNENGDNWTYFEPLPGVPKWAPGLKRVFQKRSYKWFANSDANTDFALGEFYWKVSAGEKAQLEDFISPPYMISSERTDKELFWSKGVFIPFDTMKSAIPLDTASKLRKPEIVGVCEPNPFKNRLKRNLWTAVALTAVFFVFQVYGCIKAKNQVVYQGKFKYVQTSVPNTDIGSANFRDNSFVTDVFELKGESTENVEIQIEAPNLDNKYLFFSAVLINEDTDTAYDTSIETSYYHGVDDGESWSEGSKSDSKSLAEIPPGRYYLRLESQSDFPVGWGSEYSVKVIRDVMSPAPFFLFSIFLWLPLIYTFFRSYSFESKRV